MRSARRSTRAICASDSMTDKGTSFKVGAGAEYAINKSGAIRGEWERYRFKLTGGDSDVDLWSVGVKFSF